MQILPFHRLFFYLKPIKAHACVCFFLNSPCLFFTSGWSIYSLCWYATYLLLPIQLLMKQPGVLFIIYSAVYISLIELMMIFLLLYCHRIIEQFELEGIFKGHLVQTPCNEQGHLSLDQLAQSAVQPDLDCFQGWGIYRLSGQPVLWFHHPHCKNSLLCIQSKSTLP